MFPSSDHLVERDDAEPKPSEQPQMRIELVQADAEPASWAVHHVVIRQDDRRIASAATVQDLPSSTGQHSKLAGGRGDSPASAGVHTLHHGNATHRRT